MKRILIVSDSYPPEVRSASHLMKELAIGLKEKEFEVFVATSYPQYNLPEKFKNKIYEKFTEEDGIKIIRIKTLPHHNVNFVIRGISQLIMPYIFVNEIKKFIDKIDIVIVYSPPLPLTIVGEKMKKIFRAKYLLNVQDLFPQNAIDLKILKSTILISFFKRMEKRAYKNADIITFHSEGNLSFISKKNNDVAHKFRILHNWIDVNEFDKYQRSGKFREKFQIQDKFVLLFAGVTGPSQGLEFIVKLAKRVQDIKEICFLIVGDGIEKEKLIKLTKEFKLQNVIFKSFIAKNEYPELVKDCDVGLVSLTNRNMTPVVPGKILGYMAAGIPILAFLNKESDGHKIIQEARCGYTSVWGNEDEGERLLRDIFTQKDKLSVMGKNGYNFVKFQYSKEKIVKQLLEYLKF